MPSSDQGIGEVHGTHRPRRTWIDVQGFARLEEPNGQFSGLTCFGRIWR
ncbi:MAG: hypothetical protein Q8K82_21810 [Gemmatimonadaceae bacterium]|nr:hypothetical protein [Gemmatimonadaceae bacterium]